MKTKAILFKLDRHTHDLIVRSHAKLQFDLMRFDLAFAGSNAGERGANAGGEHIPFDPRT